MALMTTTKVRINGKEVPYFEQLNITQEISNHHYLTVVCRNADIPSTRPEGEDDQLGNFKDYIGASISIEIIPMLKEDDTYVDDFQFMGMIVKIDDDRQEMGKGGLITIYACSGTIMTDAAPHYNSFHKQGLQFIAEETLQGYHRNALDFKIAPIHPQLTDEILYAVQDGCSDFEFLKRLAAYYGQWLYTTNGKTLILGAPGTKEITLTYGKDLKNMRLKLQPTPNQFMHVTDDYLEDSAQHQKDTEEVSTSSERIQQFVYQKAAELFPKKRTHYHDSPYHDNPEPRSILASRFDTQIEAYTKARALNQVLLIATSDDPGVQLGNIVRIKGQGRYRVIKVTHSNTHDGDYENHFEAIEASTEVCPKMDLSQTPKSGTQIAVVFDNADPEHMGRVQVQFPWQVAQGKHTPWIRVATTHAGLDRGAYCIPEIGDEVLLDFQGNNAERPIVIASLYNTTQTPYADDNSKTKVPNNNRKTFRTRSGHALIFDDTKGEEKIMIHDNKGSIVIFDTQAQSLYLEAAENIEITAKNISIKAHEHINIQAEGNINTASEGDTLIQAQGDITMASDSNIAIEAASSASLSGMKTLVKGETSVEVNSTQIKVAGSTTTEVNGGIVKIN